MKKNNIKPRRNNTFLLAAQMVDDAKVNACGLRYCCNTIMRNSRGLRSLRFFDSLFNPEEDKHFIWWPKLGHPYGGRFDYESRVLALLLADIIYNEEKK